MSDLTQEAADRIVASWRGGGTAVRDWESPAGPVFAAGEFAESDITMEAIFAASGCPREPDDGGNRELRDRVYVLRRTSVLLTCRRRT